MCLKVIVLDLNWQLKEKHLFLENLFLAFKYFFSEFISSLLFNNYCSHLHSVNGSETEAQNGR